LPASAARYADLLAGFLDATGVESAVLVGNSIGGAAAIHLAAARPERVSGLVLLNPGGLAPIDPLARGAIASLVRFFKAGARGARWYPRAFAAYYRLILQRSPATPQRHRITASAYEIAPVLVEAWQSFAEPAADLRTIASRLTCPVLFAWATRDQLVQLRRSPPAIHTIPHPRPPPRTAPPPPPRPPPPPPHLPPPPPPPLPRTPQTPPSPPSPPPPRSPPPRRPPPPTPPDGPPAPPPPIVGRAGSAGRGTPV